LNRALLGLLVLSAMFVFTAPAADFVPSNPKEMVLLKEQELCGTSSVETFPARREPCKLSWSTEGTELGRTQHGGGLPAHQGGRFDHVRLPIRWNDYAGVAPDFKLTNEIYAKADFLVTNAMTRGLSVIVNIHHLDEFTTEPAAQMKKFLALWKQIAAHYAGSPGTFAFELLNEPKDNAKTSLLGPIYARAIIETRKRMRLHLECARPCSGSKPLLLTAGHFPLFLSRLWLRRVG
jgi:hypothetical protein